MTEHYLRFQSFEGKYTPFDLGLIKGKKKLDEAEHTEGDKGNTRIIATYNSSKECFETGKYKAVIDLDNTCRRWTTVEKFAEFKERFFPKQVARRTKYGMRVAASIEKIDDRTPPNLLESPEFSLIEEKRLAALWQAKNPEGEYIALVYLGETKEKWIKLKDTFYMPESYVSIATPFFELMTDEQIKEGSKRFSDRLRALGAEGFKQI